MGEQVLRCYLRGRPDRWEAICVDLDIAVEAASRTDVARALEEAVASYIDAALAEDDPKTIRRLLHRRAPYWVRWPIMWSAARHAVMRSRSDKELRASFELACPA